MVVGAFIRASKGTIKERDAAFDAVDEHVAQFLNVALAYRVQGSNPDGV
jgi:hypothetical protein